MLLKNYRYEYEYAKSSRILFMERPTQDDAVSSYRCSEFAHFDLELQIELNYIVLCMLSSLVEYSWNWIELNWTIQSKIELLESWQIKIKCDIGRYMIDVAF